MSQAEEQFRDRCHFQVSLRLELFDALQILLNPESRIHPAWKKRVLFQVPRRFDELCRKIGRSSEIWPVVPAVLPKHHASFTFDQIIAEIRDKPLERFQWEILLGVIHDEDVVSAALEGSSLKASLGRVSKVKQEWLQFIGLYPYQESSPMVIALQYLIDDAEGFRKTIMEILKLFWTSSFKATWQMLQSQFERSLAEKERLFQSCSFSEFAGQALLRIQVDERRATIKAIRGGYELPLRDAKACYFIPSAFNDRRYWSALKGEKKNEVYVYFPYFDPSIAVDLHRPGELASHGAPELDPALIFKALGDSTRYAIASLVAKEPMSSVELATHLAVSKPTISHHVHQLREAGLIEEQYQGGSVQISLRRDVFERISEITVQHLFHSDRSASLKTTRRKEGTK